MRRERKIINTNIRLNLLDEADRKAWNHLQQMDRKKYKSYSRAVVAALNDYFDREGQLEADPYLETRQKEDAFLKQILEAVENGARESMPLILAGNLLEALQPAMAKYVGSERDARLGEESVLTEKEAVIDEIDDTALDFADGF